MHIITGGKIVNVGLLKILLMDSKNDLASFQLQLHEIRHFLHNNELTFFYSADS